MTDEWTLGEMGDYNRIVRRQCLIWNLASRFIKQTSIDRNHIFTFQYSQRRVLGCGGREGGLGNCATIINKVMIIRISDFCEAFIISMR